MSLLIAAILAFAVLPPTVFADDEDAANGYAADTLTIKVGYFGGPYYEKHVFTLDELEGMNKVYADYTFIDNMPSVVIDHVEGIRLSDIMAAAGIDLGSVQTFYFWTKDKTSSYYTSFPKTELIDRTRYCYYSLPDNFDSDAGTGNDLAVSDAQAVDTVISLADDWNRCIAGATFGSDYQNLSTNTRFRLIFGQTDASTKTASRSAKWVHSIVVELGGSPTVTMDASVLSLEVGSVFRQEARVTATDSAIADNAELAWSSSDDSIASVDGSGNITVHAKGSAVITATFMGASASVTVNGAEAQAGIGGVGEDGSGTGTGSPDTQGGIVNDTGQHETVKAEEINDGDVYGVLPGSGSAEKNSGGVQNWRVYEMSETAVEMPVIPEDNPLMPVIALIATCLLFGGIVFKLLKYRYDMEGRINVFVRKSK